MRCSSAVGLCLWQPKKKKKVSVFLQDSPCEKIFFLLSYIAPQSHVFKYILLKLPKIPITFYVLHKYRMCGGLQYITCFYFAIKISIEGLESFGVALRALYDALRHRGQPHPGVQLHQSRLC